MPVSQPPSFAEATRFWLKLGFISFGGPTGQIALMHEEIVERRQWLSEDRFLHALNFCMLLPGPEAQQLATYIGWLLHGTAGGVVAGCLFVLPSVFVLIGLSWVYVAYGAVPVIAGLLSGLKATVVAIVAAAVIRIGQRALRNEVMVALAALAFMGLTVLSLPFPLIVAAAALAGFLGVRRWPEVFMVWKGHGGAEVGTAAAAQARQAPSSRYALRAVVVFTGLWVGPILLLLAWRGAGDVLVQQALFFSKAAMVTFGGAYAVLPYVAQAGVETYGWLSAAQMIDGLGLAETTPGPLIMVVAFVAFLGGWAKATGLPPLVGGILGALVATYFTFLPCFLWIFAGAPFIERTRENAALRGALSAITAAVVGVVLHLAVYFGEHVLFPGAGGVDVIALAISSLAFFGLWRRGWGVVPVIVGGAAAGSLRQFLGAGLG